MNDETLISSFTNKRQIRCSMLWQEFQWGKKSISQLFWAIPELIQMTLRTSWLHWGSNLQPYVYVTVAVPDNQIIQWTVPPTISIPLNFSSFVLRNVLICLQQHAKVLKMSSVEFCTAAALPFLLKCPWAKTFHIHHCNPDSSSSRRGECIPSEQMTADSEKCRCTPCFLWMSSSGRDGWASAVSRTWPGKWRFNGVPVQQR